MSINEVFTIHNALFYDLLPYILKILTFGKEIEIENKIFKISKKYHQHKKITFAVMSLTSKYLQYLDRSVVIG